MESQVLKCCFVRCRFLKTLLHGRLYRKGIFRRAKKGCSVSWLVRAMPGAISARAPVAARHHTRYIHGLPVIPIHTTLNIFLWCTFSFYARKYGHSYHLSEHRKSGDDHGHKNMAVLFPNTWPLFIQNDQCQTRGLKKTPDKLRGLSPK